MISFASGSLVFYLRYHMIVYLFYYVMSFNLIIYFEYCNLRKHDRLMKYSLNKLGFNPDDGFSGFLETLGFSSVNCDVLASYYVLFNSNDF